MVRDGKEGGEVASHEVVKKTMATLYFMVLKGYSSIWSHCQAPCLYIHGGIKAMPNSFMGVDVEKWPIMKSHRQTAVDWGDWMCWVQCCQIVVLSEDILYTQDQLSADI